MYVAREDEDFKCSLRIVSPASHLKSIRAKKLPLFVLIDPESSQWPLNGMFWRPQSIITLRMDSNFNLFSLICLDDKSSQSFSIGLD